MDVSKLFTEVIQKEWDDLDAIDVYYKNLNGELSALRAQIVMIKKNNPDLKAEDVKQELVAFKELRYKESLLEDQYRTSTHRLAHLFNLTVVNRIDIEISAETLESLQRLSEGFKPLFFVNSQKEVEVADDEIYNKILEQVGKSLDEEAELVRLFNAPIFEASKN
jgi:hypothetical protein